MSQTYVRYIGGEAGHRSFFGGTHSKGRVIFLGLFFVAGVIGLPLLGWPALLGAVAGAGITLLVTIRTHRGSIADRSRARRRWKLRRRTGSDVFLPYSEQAWEEAGREQAAARSRTAKREASRRLGSLRAMPDGADGMGWLQSGRAVPGIAWHAPAGEPAYLSVVFSVSGQLRGIESAAVLNRAAEGWGAFLATRAAPASLARRVQTMTRVLPSDSAYQEHWAAASLDTEIPAALEDAYRAAQQSYADVIRLSSEGAMVQRHYITVCWPVTAVFRDAASKYGADREGWRALMRQEIASTVAGLTEARMGVVAALSARQVAAVMLHQQNPSRPIDLVAGLNPARPGLASRDEFSAHIVEDVDPITNSPVTWWHRTARLVPESMAVTGRTPLWVLDLLVGPSLSVRSVTFHLNLIPAAEAKASAQRDLVRDSAEILSRREAGQIDVGDTQTAMSAAQRRSKDLVAGSNHHGAFWVGHVTISARSREDLSRASRELADLCSNSLGVAQLEWQDSYQAAASGTTWPIGRGIATETTSLSARLYQALAGTSEKEAL